MKCVSCRKEKDIDDYATCKPCRESARAWYYANKEPVRTAHREYRDKNRAAIYARRDQYRKENPQKVKQQRVTSRLKNAYGITPEDRESVFERQGKKCGGCGTTDPGSIKGWATDHDHKTGVFRGVLCYGCNLALGHVKDSIPVLRGLITYLERFTEE